ncbi:MAG: SDR family NAD(P)-dependent oxidoreductase, partial [Lysobacterales bacterium]
MGMLEKKVVIVTGGAQGIGVCAAERFAEEGAVVAIWDFNAGKGAAAESQLRGKGHDVRFQQVNVTDMDSVRTAVEVLLKETGRIDVLVNNAGITR